MNWLSHILLSRRHIDHQLGNLLADPRKGRAWPGASQQFLDGMAMHKAIDRFTDRHALIKQSQSRLRDKGYLRGVVVDVLYDHFLSNHWDHFVNVPLVTFIDDFNDQASNAITGFPEPSRQFVQRLINASWLGQYGDFEAMVTTFRRIDGRLSDRIRARETNSSYVSQIEHNYQGLEQDFLAFFPALKDFFKSHEKGGDNHLI